MPTFEPVIGLEIHVQLKTASKMFCGCAEGFCPVCMGHPGTLPILNKEAVRLGLKAALGLNCTIPDFCKFDRKHYFYPDLPKGYQISQYDQPLSVDGWLDIPGFKDRRVRIQRLHLEEDAGKLTHITTTDGHYTLVGTASMTVVDFNRAGTPLAEIVTHPDFRSPAEAKAFLQELRLLMRYLNVSDADMEKGHLRCDANISLHEPDTALNTKVEVKNLNSFRSVERALEYEIKRQTKLLEAGIVPAGETRGWDEARQETVSQRSKEDAADYRYFPEPDLPPLRFGEADALFDVAAMFRELPELPWKKRARFQEQYGFATADAGLLAEDHGLANYTEQVISELKSWLRTLEGVSEDDADAIWHKNKERLGKLVSGWLLNKLPPLLTAAGISFEQCKITPEDFAEFITILYHNKVNSMNAQVVLQKMVKTGEDPHRILEEGGLRQMEDSDELETIVQAVINANPDMVVHYKKGKIAVIQFLVGQVMKQSRGKANPQVAREMLEKNLRDIA